MNLTKIDSAIAKLIALETQRQQNSINLIASENIASEAVLTALSSSLSNKYAEGYPGHRYYPGNNYIDEIETLAINRAKKLFKAEHANIQAMSGGPANLAIYTALLKPGDKIMGLKLDHGGHLSHGHKVNNSSQLYKIVNYEVASDGKLDMKAVAKIAEAEKPQLIVAGFSAYSREIDWAEFRKIADNIGAYLLADISHTAGLIAAGFLSNPTPFADVVMFTTHKSLHGPRGAVILCKQNLAEKIDRTIFPGLQGGPHMNTIAAIAVALNEAANPMFKSYAKKVVADSRRLALELKNLGFNIISGGTDNHMFVVDLTNKKISGLEAEKKLEAEHILVSRSTIPNDPRSPQDPSGIRIGTYAIASRGLKENDMPKLAKKIDEALKK